MGEDDVGGVRRVGDFPRHYLKLRSVLAKNESGQI